MKCINRLTILLANAASLAAGESCIAVSADRILASDLGLASPVREVIAFTPRPGVQRHFSRAELAGLTTAAAPGKGLCVERASAELSVETLIQALSAAFPANTMIEIVDWPRVRVPAGRLVFPESSLRAARPDQASGIVQVSGYLEYDGRKRVPLWTRARIAAKTQELVAACALPAGAVLDPSCLANREVERYPFSLARISAVDAAGRRVRHAVAAGSIVTDLMLAPRQDVRVKDEIELHVISGAAKLKMRAISESSAAAGEAISVSVAGSRRRLRAKLIEKGRAELIVNGRSL